MKVQLKIESRRIKAEMFNEMSPEFRESLDRALCSIVDDLLRPDRPPRRAATEAATPAGVNNHARLRAQAVTEFDLLRERWIATGQDPVSFEAIYGMCTPSRRTLTQGSPSAIAAHALFDIDQESVLVELPDYRVKLPVAVDDY